LVVHYEIQDYGGKEKHCKLEHREHEREGLTQRDSGKYQNRNHEKCDLRARAGSNPY
jgi:hypothetical protein